MSLSQTTYEREELLDPQWEIIQKKTFTVWCNSHLRKVDSQIEDISEDFRDGLRLLKLLSVISEGVPKPERGNMRFHKITNINKALQFVASKGVKLVSIAAEEICDGNVKMTLGMIWTIILRFMIQTITVEERSAKEGLLLWCQRKTAPYKNVQINNFNTSFKDGLAFCALIHAHRSDLIDYKKLSKENAYDNLSYAFDTADNYLDIPQMIDPEDIVRNAKPDDHSIMAYVSAYYHAFSGALQAETAATRIDRVIKNNKEVDQLRDDYDSLVTDLLQWIESKYLIFENRNDRLSLDGLQRRLADFRQYRHAEKPPKMEEKSNLETVYSTLQTRLRLKNRPAFVPTHGKLIVDITNAWKNLERLEKEYEDWLLRTLRNSEIVSYLLKKFNFRCSIMETWNGDQLASALHSFTVTECGLQSLWELRVVRKKLDAFNTDITTHHDRIEKIEIILQELRVLQYSPIESLDHRRDLIRRDWEAIERTVNSKRVDLDELIQFKEQIDQLQLEFTKQSYILYNCLEQAIEDLQDTIIVRSLQENNKLLTAHDVFEREVKSQEGLLTTLERISNDTEHIILENKLPQELNDNPYTRHTIDILKEAWNKVQKLLPEMREKLLSEGERQKSNEQLQLKFAHIANEMGPWLETQAVRVNDIALNANLLSLDEQTRQLSQLQKGVVEARVQLNELLSINETLQETLVFENVHTNYSMESLCISQEQLLVSITRVLTEIDNQILTRDTKGITQAQMDDFRNSFNHFDKNQNRKLEPLEFKACLMSIGFNLKDDMTTGFGESSNNNSLSKRHSINMTGDASFTKIWLAVDPHHTGYVTFEGFLDFVTREMEDRDNSEQLQRSFAIITLDLPYITPDILRRELPSECAEYCISQMKPYEGAGEDDDYPEDALDYASFTASIYGESDF